MVSDLLVGMSWDVLVCPVVLEGRFVLGVLGKCAEVVRRARRQRTD